MNDSDTHIETALLGGGCFWCLEALYQKVAGVHTVQSGYAGGEAPDPTYQEVCNGTTGHAEVVHIQFDSRLVDFPALLSLFWRIHDPTQLNRQGNDVGTQYRSVIFYYGELQCSQATHAITEEQKKHSRPIVTELKPAPHFYPAEPYHDRYYERHPAAPYCNAIILPKLRKMGYHR